MQIFVKTLNGKTITLSVEPSELLNDVKAKIQEKEGIPIRHQILNNGTRILEMDDKTLAFYKVSNMATLHMSLRLNSSSEGEDACEEFKDKLVESMTCEMNKEVEFRAIQFKNLENERIEISAKVSELEVQRANSDIEYWKRKEKRAKYQLGLLEYYSKAKNRKSITDEKITELQKESANLESVMNDTIKKVDISEREHVSDTQLTHDKNSKMDQEMVTYQERIKCIQKEKDILFVKKKVNKGLVDFLTNTIEEKKKDLECPVCLETAETPIYKCRMDHLVCTNCLPDLEICPECRKPYSTTPVRHRFAEKLDEEIKKLSMELKNILDGV